MTLRASILISIVLVAAGTPPALGSDPLEVAFFYTPGCRMCEPTRAAVARATRNFGDKIHVTARDMSEGVEVANQLFRMLDAYGCKDLKPAALNVFLGKTHLAGPDAIIDKLETAIAAELAGVTTSQQAVTTNRYGFWYITAAGLGDGINPCAFATVVLLVSMMASAGRSRRETLIIGTAFTLAVYLTYFLIGLLFYELIRSLRTNLYFLLLSDLIYMLAFAICVICGALSLYDAWRIRRTGNARDMTLQLPASLKNRIRKSMRKGVYAHSLLVGAFAAGAIVSVLESACTGQIYFPVIAGLVQESTTRLQGLGLLLWYNLLFILPLIIVFGASFIGVTSERIARASRSNAVAIKLFLAIVFCAMAAWLGPHLSWPPGLR